MKPGQVVQLPRGEAIVGMTILGDAVIVATTGGVYRLTPEGELVPFALVPPRRRWFQFRGFWSRVWGR